MSQPCRKLWGKYSKQRKQQVQRLLRAEEQKEIGKGGAQGAKVRVVGDEVCKRQEPDLSRFYRSRKELASYAKSNQKLLKSYNQQYHIIKFRIWELRSYS